MRIGRAFGAPLLALAASGCMIAAPLYDRRMTDAPHISCVSVNAPAAEGAPSCFALFEEDERGGRTTWSGGALRPGRTLVAIHQPGTLRCGGRFSHLVVTGATDGAGRAELSTWDSLGRPGQHRAVRWQRAEPVETLVLPTIDTVTMAAAGARARVTEGSFDPATLCFKSY